MFYSCWQKKVNPKLAKMSYDSQKIVRQAYCDGDKRSTCRANLFVSKNKNNSIG